jgi:hypothetical protein
MKPLQNLLGNTFYLLVVLALVIATVLLVGGQTLVTTKDKVTTSATQATTIEQQTVEVGVFQSPLSSPPVPPLKVIAIEPVKNGPYQNIVWSPDGKKALISKQYTQYLLARDESVPTEGFPAGFIPGTTTGLGDLWLLDLATGEERQLALQVGRYAWSPDSTQVAYLAPTETEGIAGALYVLDLASDKANQVTSIDFLGSDYAPQWLPTGEIVYVRDGQLWSIQADSKNEKVLPGFKFFNRLAAEEGKTAYLTDPDAPIGFHISPDGKRVAYKTRNKNERAIAYRLWLADVDGSNTKLITEQAEGGYYEWSPNSQWLVFSTYRDVDDSTLDERLPSVQGLWVIKADGSEVHPLYRTDGWRWIISPVWSPDSSMVMFVDFLTVEKPDSPKGVFWQGSLQVADVKEGKATLLKGLPEKEEVPSKIWWSPDGQSLFIFKDGGTPESYQSYRLTLATDVQM